MDVKDTKDTKDTAVQAEQTKLAIAAAVIPIFFVTFFAVCVIGVYHRPHPHDIKLGVVGPPAQTARLRAKLDQIGRGAYDVSPVVTPARAVHDVRQRDLDVAFVPTVDPREPATVIVASAGGRIVASGTEAFLRTVTAAQGAQLAVREVRPLPPGDAIGVGIFMFMIVCTICGYLGVSLLFTAAPDLAPRRRWGMIAILSLLVPLIAYLIGGLGFGVYKGSFGTIVAFIAIGTLYVFVIGLVTRLFQLLIGPAALFVSLAIFVFLNIPSMGATYTANVLPGFWRFLNHFWLGAETVNAERSLLYFDGQDVGWDLLRLFAWAAVITVLLGLPVTQKRARERKRQAEAKAQAPVVAAGAAV
jgi:hypothetical protein